jgi:hypothetical protein
MKQIAVFVSILVPLWTFFIEGAEPNSVRTITYDVDGAGASHNMTSTQYADGLGRTIQNKLQLSNGKARVVSSFYNNTGKLYLTTRPFVDKVANASTLFTPGDFTEINSTLNNTENYSNFIGVGGLNAYAYSETEYYNDPFGNVKRTGAPGEEHCLNSLHYTKAWTFGVPGPGTGPYIIGYGGSTTITLKDGFIISSFDDNVLDGLYSYLLSNSIAESDHFLTITRGADGLYVQELNDIFSRKVATYTINGAQIITSKYEYDIFGNLLTEIAPKNGSATLISDNRSQYNLIGQLVNKVSPDGGKFGYAYSLTGQITGDTSYDEGGTKIYRIRRYIYDDMDRLKTTEVKNDNDLTHDEWTAVVINYYDNTEELGGYIAKYNIPQWVLLALDNLRGRLVASVAVNQVNGINYYVCDLFTYDGEGRIGRKFKLVPGISLQDITYTYDIQGKILTDVTECGSERIIKSYLYDEDGQLKNVVHTNNADKVLATYTFNDHGQLHTKELATSAAHQVTYQYNIRDWVTSIGTSSLHFSTNYFSETINKYKPNGNIDNVSYVYTYYDPGTLKVENINYELAYRYDDVNRLTGVLQSGGTDFSADYAYDHAGRFLFKEEGSIDKPGYRYYPETSRLKNTSASNTESDYFYDKQGNLVLDKLKKMVIEYDWRDMPVKFKFYDEIPSAPPMFNSKGTLFSDASSYFESAHKTMLSQVVMLYDASGNRALKMGGK